MRWNNPSVRYVNYTVIGLVKKVTGQYLDRIKLGGRTRLRTLGRRRMESEELPVRQGEETGRNRKEYCD